MWIMRLRNKLRRLLIRAVDNSLMEEGLEWTWLKIRGEKEAAEDRDLVEDVKMGTLVVAVDSEEIEIEEEDQVGEEAVVAVDEDEVEGHKRISPGNTQC